MHVNKIVPFSVVILLITVSFAGIAAAAAPSEVGAIGTQLTATATPTTAPVNTNFAISGTLSVTGGTGIPGATIQLQNSTDNATWTNVTTAATNVTDANGNYQLSNNESVAGTYYYRTSYASYGQYYANATSNVVSVTVTNVTTQLTAVATPTTAPLNTAQFTINGTFSNATSSAAIPGATITLQSSTDNKTWTPNVATNVTDSNGNYSFSQSESALGTYYFRTTYAGSPTYTNATSNVVSVIVTPIATTLNATASVSTVNVSVPFTISGTLSENTSGNGISGQTITLQENESGTWTTVNTTTTNSSGFYQFTLLEPVAGTYQYRTTYDGNTVYSNAISLVVTVQVGTQTTLTAAANVSTTTVNTNFTISGTLTQTSSGAPIGPDAIITLQQNESGTWTNIANTTTDSGGNYSFSQSQSAPGTYEFRTTYAGDGLNLSAATSNVVSVNVSTTRLSIAASVPSTEINTNFTINGTLYPGVVDLPAGIANATITLQSSTDNATWSNVGTNVTIASGFYQFNQSEPTLNTYYFRTTYAGNTTLGNATSNVVSVLVNTVGTTQLSIGAAPTTVPVNVNFTISGTLNDTSGTPITGALVTLENYTNSTPLATTTTDSNGNYSFSYNESALGTYGYNTAYAGYNNGAIASSVSSEVNVTVTNVTTQLTATANVSTTTVNTNFAISGTLSTTNGTTPGPIANATIIFETYPGAATINTTTTDASGHYAFNESEPTFGIYHYQTIYAGNTTDYYANATSPVVTVQVGLPTNLTAVAAPPTVPVNTPFWINGTLSENTSGSGISGQIVTLHSNSTGNWTTLNTTTTNLSGNYSFSVSESVNGTYYYQTTYAGTSSILPATSNEVTVTVTSGPLTTTLTATPSVTSTTVNTTFTISGTLTTTSGGIANATITLNGTNTTTNSSGNYSFSLSESTPGTYQFQTTYAGNATYTNATSNTVRVTVNLIVTPTSSPAIVDSLFLFVRGSDNALWYKTWNGATWSNATSLGGTLTSSPAATSPSSGVINVFVQGTTGTVYEKTTTNSGTTWSGWTSLGGVLAAGSSPAATSPSTGVIDVFAQGTTAAVYEKTSSDSGATWSGWTSLGGVLAANSGPAATSSGSVTYVFAHGTDNAVWYKDWNGTAWSSWNSLGGVLAAGSSPAATSPASSAIDVFAQSTNGAVYEKTTANGGTTWGGWASLGGVLAAGSSPAATSESGQVYIAALGTGNVLWWKTTTSSWMSVGGI
jgi:5-hydroxyisourate hydrolase-like protein (transthyretin family)